MKDECKRILSVLLIVCLVLSLCACGEVKLPVPNQGGQQGTNQGGQQDPNQGGVQPEEDDPFEVTITKSGKSVIVEMNRMPECVEDLESVSLDNEYQSAALIVALLDYYEVDPDACFEMLDYMMGPEDISAFDKSFIKNQMMQYPYVARSYMDGATPANDYWVEEIKYVITENSHSREQDGYVKLFFQSGGADSPRGITVRHKESTDQWFLFSDTYKNVLTGIRAPEAEDKWK